MVVPGSSCQTLYPRPRCSAAGHAATPHRIWPLLLTLAGCCLLPRGAAAQEHTWADERMRPSLFEIIALDQTGVRIWPYAREDLAGDGLDEYALDEAAIDLRSVYALARAQSLWIRAYTQSEAEPDESVTAFFFLDTDARTNSGGKTVDAELFPLFEADPSPGGYEHAIGVRGDGTLVGVYDWDAKGKAWTKEDDAKDAGVQIPIETGLARDPIRLAGDDHAYYQVELPLPRFDIDVGCDSNIFVRLWHSEVDGDKRNFGDYAAPVTCRAGLNAFGDPEVLQSGVCSEDASCPAQGRCVDGTCIFAYECSVTSECRSGSTCTGGRCVRVVDRGCSASSECDGLVCDAGRCTACAESGARACGAGRVCTPAGACIRPSDAASGGAGRGGSGSGAAAASGEQVRGGAFTCSAPPGPGSPGGLGGLLALAALGLVCARRRKGGAA